MSLESIPLEVILCEILPYLHISDILTLCVISRSLNKDFNDNKIWREMYIRKKKKDFYKLEHTKMKKLVFSYNGLLSTDEREEARDTNGQNFVSLFIHNNSDITFESVAGGTIGVKAGGDKIINIRFKWESAPLTTSIKTDVKNW